MELNCKVSVYEPEMDMNRRLELVPMSWMKRLISTLLWLRAGGDYFGKPRRLGSIASSRNTLRSVSSERGRARCDAREVKFLRESLISATALKVQEECCVTRR